MLGKWNGLETLFFKYCIFAYYVHFIAYIIISSCCCLYKGKTCPSFFMSFSFIINIFVSSCKINDELQLAQAIETSNKTTQNEIETRK